MLGRRWGGDEIDAPHTGWKNVGSPTGSPLVVVQIPRNFIENDAFIDIFDLRNPTVVFFIAMLTDYRRVGFVFCGV